jgi:pimeloyl-ACP methyl ester carboxylesterase
MLCYCCRSVQPMRNFCGSAGNRLVADEYAGTRDTGIVFLHGGGQSRYSWRRAAQALQSQGFPSLIFDMRGHGDSDWIESGDYRINSFVSDLADVLSQWDRTVILIGASLGGLATIVLTGQGNPRVKAAVLVDSVPLINEALVNDYLEWLSHASDAGFESPLEAHAHLSRQFPEAVPSLASIERSMRQTPQGRWRWHWDHRIVVGPTSSSALGFEAHLERCACGIRVPLLLVRAGASDFVTSEAIEHLRQCAPQLETVVLPGARHMIVGDDNLPFVEVALPFLKRCAAEKSN